MIHKRSRAGHMQKRTVRTVDRNRPLKSATTATPRARAQVPSRAHIAPTRASRHEVEARRAPAAATRMERRRAIRRRRARIVWVACGAFCLLVLATSFPAQALIRQHEAISSASSELDRLTAGNKALQRQADELSNPANIAALARSDYDMVSPGEKAYEVLPAAGSQASKNLSSGHSLLDQGPVAPGSAQSQALLGDAGSTNSSGSSSVPGHVGDSQSAGAKHSTPGLWGRVLNTLEFWS
jgi:cell division protein FtsB